MEMNERRTHGSPLIIIVIRTWYQQFSPGMHPVSLTFTVL
jgi:hypothetical protein